MADEKTPPPEGPPSYDSVLQPQYGAYPQPPAYATEPMYPPQPGYPQPQPGYPQPQPGYPQMGYPQPPGYNLAPQTEYPAKAGGGLSGVQTDQPGAAQFIIVERPPPPNYLMLSCFVLWCCCIPVGLIAIFFSYSSTSAASKGNYDKALAQGKTAKAASIAGIVIGIIFTTIMVIVRIYIMKHHGHF